MEPAQFTLVAGLSVNSMPVPKITRLINPFFQCFLFTSYWFGLVFTWLPAVHSRELYSLLPSPCMHISWREKLEQRGISAVFGNNSLWFKQSTCQPSLYELQHKVTPPLPSKLWLWPGLSKATWEVLGKCEAAERGVMGWWTGAQ